MKDITYIHEHSFIEINITCDCASLVLIVNSTLKVNPTLPLGLRIIFRTLYNS